jgi:hypothetical protein
MAIKFLDEKKTSDDEPLTQKKKEKICMLSRKSLRIKMPENE